MIHDLVIPAFELFGSFNILGRAALQVDRHQQEVLRPLSRQVRAHRQREGRGDAERCRRFRKPFRSHEGFESTVV